MFKLVRQICNELNIPFTMRLFGTHAVSAYAEDSVSHTFDPDWIQRYGLKEHKRKLKKMEPVLRFFRAMGMQPFPNLVIRWYDGARVKEIVISGFDPSDEEKVKQFATNIRKLLAILKSVR